jgi:hypothetical protein
MAVESVDSSVEHVEHVKFFDLGKKMHLECQLPKLTDVASLTVSQLQLLIASPGENPGCFRLHFKDKQGDYVYSSQEIPAATVFWCASVTNQLHILFLQVGLMCNWWSLFLLYF